MAMTAASEIRFDVEESEGQHGLPLTTVRCHGRLTSGNSEEIKRLIKPLIEAGGRHIVIDCTDLESIDSSGLGALVGLKISAIHKGLVKLELVNLSPRVTELLKLTNLVDLFAR
ncbi:MAG: STAS domain-containing protein [Silvibacterium sp.]|nr:STAS domain-containing protein [Silvibacterium sp.]